MRTLANIFWLGTKELRSVTHDVVLLALVAYSFSLAIISQAQSSSQEVHNASIAVVDEDHSELSRRISVRPVGSAPDLRRRSMRALFGHGR